jgi:molybdenum cofactor synthesis domain-containing protein
MFNREECWMERNVEIICIGNELLIGKVLNTNAHWLAKRVTSLGMIVKRMTVAGDDMSEIVSVVREALHRKPQFIITTGGLGPTFDDKTLEGIAKALNREWEIDDKALGMVRHKYETFAKEGRIEKVELTPPRLKMAKFPKDTKPLPNPVGTAPAMMANIKETVLIALPGVPSEMEAIFEGSIAQWFRKAAGKVMFYETSIYADGIMESRIAPLIDQVMHDNPRVYIKSHPHREERKPHLELHFSTTAEAAKVGRSCISKAMSQLEGLIRKNGGKVKTVREEN